MATTPTRKPGSGSSRPQHGSPVTLAELRERRELVVPGPSGFVYRIRPLNLGRHIMAGGLPERLRDVAIRAIVGESPFREDSTDEEKAERLRAAMEYRDALVRHVIVEPDLHEDALDELPPVDYEWAAGIAEGDVTVDGNGDPLWGAETLARFRGAARE